MEDLKQLLSRPFLALEQAEARLLHLQELLRVTRRERDEAQEQLLKLGAEYCNMLTNRQQQVGMSIDQLGWPMPGGDLNVDDYSGMHCDSFSHSPPDQFSWNSTPTDQFDLEPGVSLHRTPTTHSNFDCSNLLELKDQPFYHQNEQPLGLVELQQSEHPQQVESHSLGPPPSGLGCIRTAMPAQLPESPKDEFEVRQGTLPERGNLLEAVKQAGPLLETLLLTGPLPQWKHPPPAMDFVEIPRISLCSSPDSPQPIGPVVHHVPSPQGLANPLQVNAIVSSSRGCLRPRSRINKSPNVTLITCRQSGTASASSSSKFLVAPVLNSLDSAITRGRILKLPRRIKQL